MRRGLSSSSTTPTPPALDRSRSGGAVRVGLGAGPAVGGWDPGLGAETGNNLSRPTTSSPRPPQLASGWPNPIPADTTPPADTARRRTPPASGHRPARLHSSPAPTRRRDRSLCAPDPYRDRLGVRIWCTKSTLAVVCSPDPRRPRTARARDVGWSGRDHGKGAGSDPRGRIWATHQTDTAPTGHAQTCAGDDVAVGLVSASGPHQQRSSQTGRDTGRTRHPRKRHKSRNSRYRPATTCLRSRQLPGTDPVGPLDARVPPQRRTPGINTWERRGSRWPDGSVR